MYVFLNTFCVKVLQDIVIFNITNNYYVVYTCGVIRFMQGMPGSKH